MISSAVAGGNQRGFYVGPSWKIESDPNKMQNTKRFMDQYNRPVFDADERDRALRHNLDLINNRENILRVDKASLHEPSTYSNLATHQDMNTQTFDLEVDS